MDEEGWVVPVTDPGALGEPGSEKLWAETGTAAVLKLALLGPEHFCDPQSMQKRRHWLA